MNQININQIIDQVILFFASVTSSSLHLEIIIFIPAKRITKIAIIDKALSINKIIQELIVFS
jgi:hypothetical protein